jgi:hypothetical protein
MTVSYVLRAKGAAAVRIAAGVANGECRKNRPDRSMCGSRILAHARTGE